MNKYGHIAMKHWKSWLPQRYQAIEDPETFFRNLGEEILTRVTDLDLAIAGEDPPGETYMEKLGRLNMARLDAESEALREMALLPPESDLGPEGEADDERRESSLSSAFDQVPRTEDPNHPYWKQIREMEEDRKLDA